MPAATSESTAAAGTTASGNGLSDGESATTAADPDEEVRSDEREANERNNVVKEIGEKAWVTDYAEETLYEFKVTSIDVDLECTTGYAEEPANGHYVGVDIDMTTSESLAGADIPEVWMTPFDFSVVSPEGTTENDSVGNGYSCLQQSELFPDSMGPGEHAVGTVVLDTAHPTGAIVYSNPALFGGWEWGF